MIVAAVILGTSLCPFSRVYAEDRVPRSSFEYKKYKEPIEYREALRRRMNDVYKSFTGRIDDEQTIPIPGLVETYTEEKGAEVSSENYIPQGLCRAGDYMLTTAYDVSKKHNSVVYVVDIQNKQLVTTLTMPNKFHAGGIAFDGENIWMTGETSDKYKGRPFVQYMTYETLLTHLDKPLSRVKKKELSGFIYINNKPSFLECDNGKLWVGTYIGRKNTSEGYINGYDIIGEPGDRKLNTLMYSMITGIDSSSQGVDFEDGYLYVSSSYKGTSRQVKSSFITVYDLKSAGGNFSSLDVRSRELKRVEVPKMNEEILVDGAIIHINFESGAAHWKRAVINTDRILAVRKSLWRPQ